MSNTATDNQALADALAESLMTMGFIDAFPFPSQGAPDAPVLIRVPFTGPRRGALEILTSDALGAAMAANMLGADPGSPDAAARGRDALKELVNVTCGLLLSKLPDPTKPAMSIPHVRQTTGARWDAVSRRTDVVVLDAEGNPIAARIRGVE